MMENNAEPLRLLVTTLIIDYLAVTSEEMQVSPVFPPLPSYVFLISANHRIFCMHTRFRSTSPPPGGHLHLVQFWLVETLVDPPP